jgi:alkanesulfonate monooxygenase SsuD/methylene tetrahydromethanopterin reductase-like flavin-dependent oxidoreductase (luciferase family)
MTKQIRLNAFDMNCVGHIQHGMWTHPRDTSWNYNTLAYWQHLARTAERGLFDGIFLADIVGVYDVYKDSPAASIINGVQIPVNDPMLLVPAMAAVTSHVGFGVTSNLTYEPPYLFARRASTLDHLTGGRFGWNIVTGYLDSAARGMGRPQQPDHDTRYDVADEYMESSTSCGREAGRTMRSSATKPTVSSPTQRKSIVSVTRGGTTTSTRSTCRSLRRSARRCCIRPGHRRGEGNLPQRMRNVFSSTVPIRTTHDRSSATFDDEPCGTGAIRQIS